MRVDEKRSVHRRSAGFTLLEVLIGLLVLALALFALVRAASSQVNAFADVRERTLAGWLAAEVLAETRLTPGFPAPGKTDGQRRFADRDWRYEVAIQSTPDATIMRLDVRVFTAADRSAPLAQLSGFRGQDLRQ
jgi:general secretion pathway protein I